MDGDNGLSMRNWGYYEPTTSLKEHLGLQLMSSVPEKPPFATRNPVIFAGTNAAYNYRDIGVSQAAFPVDYMRNTWINQREKYFNMIPGNPSCAVVPETSSAHQMQMVQQTDLSREEIVVEVAAVEKPDVSNRKRQRPKTPKSPKGKKLKRDPKKDENIPVAPRARSTKKSAEVIINGIDLDIRCIPIPVCSCTGTPQQCYRWGSGGWQSACCTTGMSIYPLPMSTKRRGARIAGRKMSIGAFKKVLEKLASEGYNFSNPIDLRTHWAKHGTNKFVTIR